MASFVETYRQQTMDAITAINLAQVEQAIEWFREARAEGRMIFVAGNGGSAATASHLVCDLVKDVSYQKDLRFRAMALQDAIPTATAYSNDVDFTEGDVQTDVIVDWVPESWNTGQYSQMGQVPAGAADTGVVVEDDSPAGGVALGGGLALAAAAGAAVVVRRRAARA